jgi:CHAT domain-containing protein
MKMLTQSTHLIVLPDGALNSIPFDLMSSSDKKYKPIISTKTVRLAPSLRYLAYYQKQHIRSAHHNSGFFGLGDAAYTTTPNIAGLSKGDLEFLSRGHAYLSYFNALPETRREVEQIGRLFQTKNKTTLFGSEACESNIKNHDFTTYNHLHFATHGILGGEVPGIVEPSLVMAEEPGEDGFFSTSEVLNLKLNAELTVLSACNTGSGEFYTGEGVMGMSRAFLIAGSQRVLVSLWPIPSLETEKLMIAFYKKIKAGVSPEDALRAVKLAFQEGRLTKSSEVSSDRGIRLKKTKKVPRDSRHPFYWAAFVLIGI